MDNEYQSQLKTVLLELARLSEHNQRSLNEAAHLTQEIEAVRSSTSWRVTAPLRGFSRLIRRSYSSSLARRMPGALVRRIARVARRYAPGLYYRFSANPILLRIYLRLAKGTLPAHSPHLFVGTSGRQVQAVAKDDYRETLSLLLKAVQQWNLGKRIDG